MAAAVSAPRGGTSLVGAGDGATEGWRGLLCGVLFGVTSPLVGHPIDTIKTLMSASPAYARGSAVRTLVDFVRAEGPLALYRGLLPPLFGSSVFRSVQFSAYGALMGTFRDSPALTAHIPGAAGMEWRVPLAGVLASTARALIETPLEYVKVRRQTGQRWLVAGTVGGALAAPGRELRAIFTGFGVSWARTVALMTTFFIQVDHLERHHRDLMAMPVVGPFVKGGLCATTAWVLVWPLEVLKNQVQAATAAPGLPPAAGWAARAAWVLRERGVVGLYRGIGPGLTRSVVANGSSMVVYAKCCEAMRAP